MIVLNHIRLSGSRNRYYVVWGLLCLSFNIIGCHSTSSTGQSATPTSASIQVTATVMSISDAIRVLEDPLSSGDTRAEAALALATYGPLANVALNPLIATLKYQSSSDARWAASEALGEIGAETALIALIDAWKNDPASAVRESAGQAIAKIVTTPSSENLSLLISGMSDESAFVRTMMIQALGKMGEQAAPSIPALVQVMYSDPDRLLRAQAAYALQVITGERFSNIPNTPYWEGGYKIDTEKDEAFIVLAAQNWWEEIGQTRSWPEP